METNNILLRICVIDPRDQSPNYTTDFNWTKNSQPKKLTIGSEIKFEGKKYTIERIEFELEESIINPPEYGYSLRPPHGQEYPYNSTLTFYLKL